VQGFSISDEGANASFEGLTRSKRRSNADARQEDESARSLLAEHEWRGPEEVVQKREEAGVTGQTAIDGLSPGARHAFAE
jgi:hypothetical protein